MMFVNSLKLFGSNFTKTLKFFLYYIVVLGVCFALLLPSFFEFKDMLAEIFASAKLNIFGVFNISSGLGLGLRSLVFVVLYACVEMFKANLGLAIYAFVVMFVVLPFLVNIGKYALDEMLYSYMTSNTKLGFFSALIKGLKRSVPFAICKTLYNLVFSAIVFAAVFGLAMISNEIFVTYFFVIIVFLVLVLLFTFNQISVLGWACASIVFDCNVFSAYRKGIKAVKRHFWSIFGTTVLYFFLFWLVGLLCGACSFVVLIPLMTCLLCVYDMTVFFTSQGMRFYINNNKILTPKKLEEVDNINKTASIL